MTENRVNQDGQLMKLIRSKKNTTVNQENASNRNYMTVFMCVNVCI